MLDIYYNPHYGKLCEYVEAGSCEEFSLTSDFGTIKNIHIKRAVPFLLNGKQYYDIVTPYGYGGPMIYQENDKEKLLSLYNKEFADYCYRNNIVCEFIRFHPIYKNYEDFGGIYDAEFSRHTIGTNLQDFEDPVQSEFSKSAKKEIRKAKEKGVYCTLHEKPKNLEVFKRLYEETMDRNHAKGMYYFPEEYYRLLTHDLSEFVLEIQAHIDDTIIASEIYFVAGDIMHAHLLGSNKELLEVGGGVMLEEAAARWGKEKGYRFIHHGGGRSDADDDPLFLYKKKFGKNTQFDFYTAKKIWQKSIYECLVKERVKYGPLTNSDYFPIYRG